MDNSLQGFENRHAEGKRVVDLAFLAGSSTALIGEPLCYALSGLHGKAKSHRPLPLLLLPSIC
jgi:hypothetical protein